MILNRVGFVGTLTFTHLEEGRLRAYITEKHELRLQLSGTDAVSMLDIASSPWKSVNDFFYYVGYKG